MAAPGPHLRRPARQHRHPPVEGPRRAGPWSWPPPPSTGSACAPRGLPTPPPGVMLPQVGQGAIGGGVPGRRRAPPQAAGRHRRPRARTWRCAPSGRSSPGWAAAATCRSAPSPATRGRLTASRSSRAMVASIDGGCCSGGACRGRWPTLTALGAALAADLLDRAGGRAVLDADGAGTRPPGTRPPTTVGATGDRLPGRCRPRRPGPAHRAGRRGAGRRRRRRPRPPGRRQPARPGAGRGAGASTSARPPAARCARTTSTTCSSIAGRPSTDGGAAQGRRPVRVRAGRRGGPGPRRRRCRLRGGARRSPRRSPCPPTPGCR